MWTWHVEVFPFVVDFSDERWVGIDSGFAIEFDAVGAPGGVPEFVDNVHVFFADCIAFVMFGLGASVCEVSCCGVEVSCT